MIVTLQGLNGSGKSIYLRTIQEAQILLQAKPTETPTEAEAKAKDTRKLKLQLKSQCAEARMKA